MIAFYYCISFASVGFPPHQPRCGSAVKNLPANARMQETWVPSLGRRCPAKGNGNPLQYSCLGNSRDRGASGYSPRGRKESDTTERLNNDNNHHLQLFTLCYFLWNRWGQSLRLLSYLIHSLKPKLLAFLCKTVASASSYFSKWQLHPSGCSGQSLGVILDPPLFFFLMLNIKKNLFYIGV